MAVIGKDTRPVVGIPHLYSRVIAAGGDVGAIGRPGYIEHRIQMTWIHRNRVINVDIMVIVMDSGGDMVIRFAMIRAEISIDSAVIVVYNLHVHYCTLSPAKRAW